MFLLVFIGIIVAIFVPRRSNFTNIKKSKYGTAKKLPRSKKLNKKKIAVIVVSTNEIEHYSKYTIPVIKKWCQNHSYDFYNINENLIKELPINFTKIQACLNIIDNYDYVIHIDADATIVDLEYPIEYIIDEFMKDSSTHALFSEDCYSSSDCSQPGKQNSGVFIIKNSFLGREILLSWKSESITGMCKKYVNQFPSCQLVLWNCVVPRYPLNIKTISYNILNGVDGLLINHYMQNTKKERVEDAREIYLRSLGTSAEVYS